MTAVAGSAAKARTGSSTGTRLAAIAVLIALTALAYYSMFSGPTRVPIGGPSKVAPRATTPTAPPAGEKESEGEGGGGD